MYHTVSVWLDDHKVIAHVVHVYKTASVHLLCTIPWSDAHQHVPRTALVPLAVHAIKRLVAGIAEYGKPNRGAHSKYGHGRTDVSYDSPTCR